MEEEGRPPRRIDPFQATVAVVLVAAVVIGYLVATRPSPSPTPEVVGPNDRIVVNYIGFFPDGRVFDTTFPEVATDNVTYPKALSFQYRGDYRPIAFDLGGAVGAAAAIPGFTQGILEPTPMRVGETREVVVPPELGYGLPDPSRVEERSLEVELPQYETFLRSEFEQEFEAVDVVGVTFSHPFWGWPVRVVQTQGSFVTIQHLVEVDQVVRPHDAWEARVTEVDGAANGGGGRIVVEHLLDARDVGQIQAEDGRGTFRVVAVDPAAGTYTVDYNRQVVGQTLIFQITLVRLGE